MLGTKNGGRMSWHHEIFEEMEWYDSDFPDLYEPDRGIPLYRQEITGEPENMFGFISAIHNIQQQKPADPEALAKAEAERDALRKVEKEGKGICKYCDEEIYKNDSVPGGGWTWESEILVGYCPQADTRHGKHVPKISWQPEIGAYLPDDE
jgi:hypothetical protein